MTDSVTYFNTVPDVQQVENLLGAVGKLEKAVSSSKLGQASSLTELGDKLKALGTAGGNQTTILQAAAEKASSSVQKLQNLQTQANKFNAEMVSSGRASEANMKTISEAFATRFAAMRQSVTKELTTIDKVLTSYRAPAILVSEAVVKLNSPDINRQVAAQVALAMKTSVPYSSFNATSKNLIEITDGVLGTKETFKAALAQRVAAMLPIARESVAMLANMTATGLSSNTKTRKLDLSYLVDTTMPSAELYRQELARRAAVLAPVAVQAQASLANLVSTGLSSNIKTRKLDLSYLVDTPMPSAELFRQELARRAAVLAPVAVQAQASLANLVSTGLSSNIKTRKLDLSYLVDTTMPSAELYRQELARRAAVLRTAANQAQASLSAAMANPAGIYQQVSFNSGGASAGSLVQVQQAFDRTGLHATKFGSALKTLGIDMNTVHSAARGLASGFGALWLTWGQMIPLLAGAGVSFGLKSIITMGAQVQDKFTQISTLAGASTESIRLLNLQMHDMATSGPFGPLAIADAMKTLSLAGLKANEVLAAMPNVTNFAMAGTLDLQKAADALTTIGVAFTINADGYGYIADVMSKAAAESKSSVEGMTEAFKTASVINQQYGVSLEDTAIGLSLMANAGITGTAAGTALRNMYADLAERTPKVRKELEKLGVSGLDPVTGKMKEQSVVFKDLMTALATKSPKDQMLSINAIFTERGSKSAIAIMNAMKKELKLTEDEILAYSKLTGDAKVAADKAMAERVKTVYSELAEAIRNSAGFASIAAAKMSLDPLNQMKLVGTTLQSTLVEIFDSLSPMVLEMSKKLQNLFKSDDFKGGVTDLAVKVANLTVFLFDHAKAIANAVLIYYEFKGVLTVLGAVMIALETRAALLAAAQTAAAAATAAAATASAVATAAAAATTARAATGLSLLFQVITKGNPVLLILSGLAAAVAAGYAWMSLNGDKAAASTKSLTDNTPDLVEALEKEYNRLLLVNQARREGISLAELETRVKVQVAQYTETKGVTDAKAALDAAKKRPVGSVASMLEPTFAEYKRAQEILALEQTLTKELEKQDTARAAALNLQGRIVGLAATQAEAERKAQADRNRNNANGIADAAKAAKQLKEVTGAHNTPDNSMEIIAKRLSDETKAIKDESDKQRAILKANYDARLIDEGTFAAEDIRIIEKSAKERVKLAEEAIAEEEKAYAKKATAMAEEGARQAAAMAKNAKPGQLDLQAQQLAGALQSLAQTANQTTDGIRADIGAIKSDALTKIAVESAKSRQALLSLRDASEKFWELEDYNRTKATNSASLEESLRYTDPAVAAGIKAAAAETSRYADEVQKLDKQYRDTDKAVESFKAKTDMSDLANSPGGLAYYKSLVENLNQIVFERDKLAAGASFASLFAANAAKSLVDRETIARLTGDVATALEEGLTKGAGAGIKALRNIIVSELSKTIRLNVQAFINPIVGQITGALGLTGTASTVGSAANLASGASSMLGVGSAVSDFVTGVGSVAGFGAASAGAVAANAGLAGTIGITAAEATAAATAAGAAAGASTAAGLGASISSAIAAVPVWGWIAGGILALASSLDKSGTPHSGGSSSYSSSTGLTTATAGSNGWSQINAVGDSFGSVKVTSDATTMTSGLVKSIVGILDSTAQAFGKTAGYTAATSFADDSSKDGAWGSLVISKLGNTIVDWADTQSSKWAPKVFADGTTGSTEYLAAISADVRSALEQIGLPEWATKLLNNLGASPSLDQLAGAVDTINKTVATFKSMGEYMTGFSDISETGKMKIVEAAGGIDALGSAASNYYAAMYSEQEKTAVTTKQFTDALTAVNQTIPTSVEGYRNQVAYLESIVDTEPSAAEALLVMYKVAPAFASVNSAAASVAVEVAKLEAPLRSVSDIAQNIIKLTTDADNLNIKLLQTMGDQISVAEATRLQRNLDIKGLTDTEVALYDANVATQTYIDTIIAQRKATEDGVASYERYFSTYATAADKQARALRNIQGVIPANVDSLDEFRGYIYGLTVQFGVGSAEVKRATDIADDFAVAFPDVATALTDTTTATTAAVETINEALARLRGTTRSSADIAGNMITLQEKLFQLQNAGNQQALNDHTLAGLSDVVDPMTGLSERDTQKLIFSLEQTSTAAVAAASNMDSLTEQLFQVQNAGNIPALRTHQLSTLSAVKDAVTGLSEQDIQVLIWSFEDAKTASDALAASLANIANERKSIEDSLYQSLNMTVQIRGRELAALDPTNRALKTLSYTVGDIQTSITSLTTTIADLDNVIAQARTTSNSLRVALGGTDSTEANLWAKLNNASTSTTDRLSAINDLLGVINTSITADTTAAQTTLTTQATAANDAIAQTIQTQLDGQQLQLDNAQKLLDYGTQLADFVKSLRLGELSTSTPAEKLAQAQATYMTNLSGAQAGDATSAANLQASATDYLTQARSFDPEAYNRIFASVTGQLTSLSQSSVSGNQQIIDAANSQISILNATKESLTTQVSQTVVGNVISDVNRQKLTSLLDLATNIEANAVIERAAAQVQLTHNENSLAAIKLALELGSPIANSMVAVSSALADSGLIASSSSAAVEGLTGISAEMSASNDEIIAELQAINEHLSEVVETIIAASGADASVQNAVADRLIAAVNSSRQTTNAPAIV